MSDSYQIMCLLDGTKFQGYIEKIVSTMPMALPFIVKTAADELFKTVKKQTQGPVYSNWRPGQPGTGRIPVPRRSFRFSRSIKMEPTDNRRLGYKIYSSGLDAPHNVLVHEGTDFSSAPGVYPPRRVITDTFKEMQPMLGAQVERMIFDVLNRLRI